MVSIFFTPNIPIIKKIKEAQVTDIWAAKGKEKSTKDGTKLEKKNKE